MIRDDPDKPSLVLDPNHKLHCLLHEKARYKILRGGRGSTKSWGVAEALIRRAQREPLRVLCAREFQNTMRDSSHRLLQDTIYRLGLEQSFVVTKDMIRSATGAEFIFRGLHGQQHSIRSIEGINVCWVEEAQTTSEESWRALTPTIRGDDSEIWATYNLIDENDPTHHRFVNLDGSPKRPRTIVRALTYLDNPYFPEVLREEMEFDKENDPDMFRHVWLGEALKIDNAIIFHGKCNIEVFDPEQWREAERLHFGADFGFSQDPSTLMRNYVLDVGKGPELWVDGEAYGTEVAYGEYDEFYSSVPEAKNWPIYADCSQPATISHIQNTWCYNIRGAEKWDGSIVDGINYLRHFRRINIHPALAPNLVKEARMYRFKKDKLTGDVLPIIIDKHNHCWDGLRYSHDGYIQRSGELGMWGRLGGASN